MTSRILPRKPRLCIFSYGAFTPLVNAVVPEFADRADIHVQEVVLEEALRVGREIDQSHAHDVMISAGANASLLQTTTDGKHPVALGSDSRLYYFSGVPHALRLPGTFTKPGKEAAYPYNANVDLADGMNAQLENLRSWVVNNIAPPPTIAPVLGSTLVAVSDMKFPAIPGIRVPTNPPPLWQLDLGREYSRMGIISEPVHAGPRYPLLVPAVDSDGNELGGWRGAMSSVPLGTFTAWDWKSQELAPFGFISGLNGAFIPFARTRAERLAANDPRLSIEERYGNRDGFMKAATASIDDAIAKRFLLSIQREYIIAKMGRNWDDTMKFDWYLGKRVEAAK